MTREVQKKDEGRTLHSVLDILSLNPDKEPEFGEAPDFIINVGGRRIGVEITLFSTGATTQGLPIRAIESEWERLFQSAEEARKQPQEFHDLNVGVMFLDKVPPRRDHTRFIDEVFEFAHSHRADLSDVSREFWPRDFHTPLLRTYLRTLYLCIDPYAQWYSNITAGWVGRPDRVISAIVAEKSRKACRQTDEIWLVIQCTHRISETIIDLMGVKDFAAIPTFFDCIFSRVFVLAFTGSYEWSSATGWRALDRN